MSGPLQLVSANTSRLLRRAMHAHGQGALEKAQRLYTAVLEREPDSFDALHGLGLIHCQYGRFDTALVLFQEALKSDLDRAEGFSSLGLVFHRLRQFERALTSYNAGLQIEPDNPELLNRRGVALLELGRPAEALADFDRVFAADADHFEALGNRGNALLKLNRVADALAAYDLALQSAPESVQLLTNRAVALRRLDRPHEALLAARQALVRDPDFAQAQFTEAIAQLSLADFTAWPAYEMRWKVGLLASQRRNCSAPLWLGKETLEGRTILLHAEQGSGDTLQLVRYVPLVAARGARVILEVQRELVRLLSDLSGVDAVIARGEVLPPFDLHCPLFSLPLAFGTNESTIPADVPYIVSPANDAWQRVSSSKPLIGLVWSGGRFHDNDTNRSLRFETLLPLLDVPDVSFVSLQHDVREGDVSLLDAQTGVVRFDKKFQDFADTAAAIASLDVVIAVDTAVAHLAGAMGKPLLLLLPFAADFRWLRGRQDTPWYPTARLYRQPAFGDWQSVIATLHRDLIRADFSSRANKLSA